MPRSCALMVLWLVLGLALAGCFGGDDKAPKADGDGLADDAVATEGAGAVAGQVVTSELEVIEGASVGLSLGGELVGSTTTDARGKFTFNGVEPGDYRVQVSSVCCKVGVKEVAVSAGEVTETAFQLSRLTQADLRVPFVDEREWKGFISCGVGLGAASVAVCAAPGILGLDGLADENEEFIHFFNFTQGVQDAVFVLDWKPVGGVSGTDLWLNVENDGCGATTCSYRYVDMTGQAPLRADVDDAVISDAAWKWSAIQAEAPRELQFRVFASPATPNVVYQQPFTVYYTAFVYRDAPDDYDPVPDQ